MMVYKKILLALIIFNLNLSSIIILVYNNNQNNSIEFNENLGNIKSSSNGDRAGKVFSIITIPTSDGYINRDQPNLNKQPEIYMPNYFISHGNMNFENITALNYTKEIEADPTDYIFGHETDQTFIYQSFSVELDQYINNLSINILDVNDGGLVTYNNSWEVAILNCSTDEEGIIKPDQELGALLQPPLEKSTIVSKWYDFDFKNSDIGPIYLNTSKTSSFTENGIEKFWFAFRVKIPPQTTGTKILYFRPDGGDSSDIGEGHTFKDFERVFLENFTHNNVTTYLDPPINGNYIEGNLSSFVELDEKRYIAAPQDDNMSLGFNFTLQNVSRGTYEYFRNIGLTPWLINWYREFPIFSIDIEISTKIDNIENIEKAILYMYNFSSGDWLSLENDINITTDDETVIAMKIWDPYIIKLVLDFIDNNNNMTFKMEYNGTAGYTVSINKFTVSIGENNTQFNTIQRYDPFLIDNYIPNSYEIVNGTKDSDSSLRDVEYYDNEFFKVKSDTNNLSIEFKFINVLQGIDMSLFDDISIVDFWVKYPNPILWFIDLDLRANVSISSPNNLSYAALEIYKGTREYEFLNATENANEWIQLSQTNKALAMLEPFKHIPERYDGEKAYQYVQFLNESDDNSLRFRLRYVWNLGQTPPPGGFNVTVENFKLDFYVQNAITSDIASKIGFGLNSKTLEPEDIKMKNFGIEVSNVDNQTGSWNGDIPNGIPTLGLFEFNVTSIWHAIIFTSSGSYDLYKYAIDIDFDDDTASQYETGKNTFAVEVTDAFGVTLAGLEITFKLLDEDGKVVDEDTAVTNNKGIAKGSLEFDEVGDGYKIEVNYDKVGIYASKDIDSDEFRIVDDFTIFMDNLMIWLPYILIGLAAIVTFAAVRYHKLSNLRKYWAREALTLDDLIKISYILILHKDAGVTIYNEQISMDLDSDLIGGFLTAISQFRSELKKDIIPKSGEKGFEMDYYDFKIVITDGKYARVALILDGIPSESLKENQWDFTRRFEMKFGANLSEFQGDIRPFKETNDLVDRVFDIKLMYPLQLANHWEFTKLNKLERALVEVGLEMQKERKYIFSSSLLSYGLAGRKASRDQIISTILDLKRRGILIPMEIE